ncbi:MAG: hypothetical protein HYS27_00205 [Deltaproteobacteria bacterium]|nr:hypothetical protein [Deltaproteobacteria bacterium]
MTCALLVANPTAQSGKAMPRIARAKEGLGARGFEVTLLATEPAGRTVAAVARRLDDAGAATRVELVVAMGGDGTFAEAAKGVLASSRRVPMALLPAGTANDQARSLGIPLDDIDAALDIATAGHLTRLDVGEVRRLENGRAVDEQLFFDSVGFGFQAEVLKKRGEDRARVSRVPLLRDLYRDYAVYAGALVDSYLKSFVEPTKMTAELVADGRSVVLDAILDLVVKNTAVYGGAWVLARDGRPDDGKMEVVPFAGRRDMVSKMVSDLSALPALDDGLEILGVEQSRAFAASQLEVVLRRPGRPEVCAQIDGEDWCLGRHFKVDVLPNALDVVTPAGFAPPWRA